MSGFFSGSEWAITARSSTSIFRVDWQQGQETSNSSRAISTLCPFIGDNIGRVIRLRLTRRGLLQSAGGVLATAGFPESTHAAALPASQLMSRLSTYMSGAGNRKLPDQIVEKTKHVILDALAAMISGSELPPGRFAI